MIAISEERAAAEAGEAAVNKAVVRAAEFLKLSQGELGEIIGLPTSSASRFVHGRQTLRRDSKQYQLALLFVRAFRSLDAISGGDERYNREWLRAENTALHAVPLTLMKRPEGLSDVLAYLDSRRALV